MLPSIILGQIFAIFSRAFARLVLEATKKMMMDDNVVDDIKCRDLVEMCRLPFSRPRSHFCVVYLVLRPKLLLALNGILLKALLEDFKATICVSLFASFKSLKESN